MDILNIAVKDQSAIDKIMEFINSLKSDSVELIDKYEISQEDLEDLKDVIATRGEETISLEEFMKL